MKQNLFLSVLSVFAVLHLCKAGPLRLHKRAAFYIANETACVVDNIVYSNGDPIPTDDPCEACRCRPPGFACVLKECKIKPGCRAVRHSGQCCPEYVCGCEHNGRMYKDGDEITDAENPCYKCHCQGSSIACAFVDCLFRDDCDSVFEPGECCPKYTNCTEDAPDRNPFEGGNALPSINLLPDLINESFQSNFGSTEVSKQSEPSTYPTEQPQPMTTEKETVTPESSESVHGSSEPEADESKKLATEESILDPEVQPQPKDPEAEIISHEEAKDLPQETEDKNPVETVDDTKVLLNSETDIKKDDSKESTTIKEESTETSEVKNEGQSSTTIATTLKGNDNDVDVTEKSPAVEMTTTKVQEVDPPIKNSASENSKSLKLSDDDETEDSNKEAEIQSDKKEKTEDTVEKTATELPTQLTSEEQKVDLKEDTSTEINLESEENIAEESQTNPQATSFYSNNEKIKSESAETVTIVVHVKDKVKPSTVKDLVTENSTPESATRATQENLLQSSDKLTSPEASEEPSKTENIQTTAKNFEVFPSSTEISKIESTSVSVSKDQISTEAVQSRSEEIDSIALEAEETSVSEEKEEDSKIEEDSSVVTTINEVSGTSKAATVNEEVTEGSNAEKPKVTVIRIDPNGPVTVEIITDSAESTKSEVSTKEPEKVEAKSDEVRPETRENEEEKLEVTEQSIPQSTEEVKEKSTTTEKIQESTPSPSDDKPEERTDEESKDNEKEENSEGTETEVTKSEDTTVSEKQTTEEPNQTSTDKE